MGKSVIWKSYQVGVHGLINVSLGDLNTEKVLEALPYKILTGPFTHILSAGLRNCVGSFIYMCNRVMPLLSFHIHTVLKR